MKKGHWNCTSTGPQNNGLLENCDFYFRFDESVGTPHCPVCASPMVWKSEGKTISELLHEGLGKEKKVELYNKKP